MSESDLPTDLTAAARRSLLWTAVGKYASNLATLGITAVLTRLLTPADFGLIAMVLVISGFLTIIAEAGLSTAVVQKRDLSDDALSSLFWFGTLMGLGAALALAGLAPLVARFFDDPRLTPVVAATGLGFVFIAIGRVPNGLLERTFQFRTLAICEISASLAGGLAGIAAALTGLGYWALVLQILTSGLVNATLRLRLSRWAPRRVFRFALVRSIYVYSSGVTAFSAINYWARNLDKALIGRLLGATELGYYGRAYALMLYPLETINGILNPTLHPLLSELQSDRPRMARMYLRIATLVGCIAVPVMAVMATLAPEIVRTVWGLQWERSIDVFAILCIVGSVQPIGATFGSVFLATNRTRLLALSGLINACVIMSGMALGVRFGIEGVAIGYSCAYGLIFFPTMYVVVVVLLGARLRDMLAVLVPPMTIGLPVLGALLGYNALLRGRWGDVPHLIVGVLAGLVLWAVVFFLLERKLLAELVGMLPAPLRARLARLGLVAAER